MSKNHSVAHPITPAAFSVEQAAHYLGLSKAFLDKARCRGDGPTYLKLGSRVRYRREALDEWLRAHERQNTSQAA
jgi:excisionase family DNA binding protein